MVESIQTGTPRPPADVRAALARVSRTGELPAMPGVATRALGIARDPNADVEALCRAIQADVGIAARVLRVANSAVYGRRTACKSLRDAVTTVGLRTMQDILSAAALRSVVDLGRDDALRLWDHSLAVAIAAEELARSTGAVRRGMAFLPGLFHDVGRIVLLVVDGAGYAAMAAREGGDLCAREREWLGFDHAEVGAAVAADWGLPGDLCEVVRWHHEPARATSGAKLARLIATADRLVTDLGLGAGDATPVAECEVPADEYDALAHAVREAYETERGLFA